MSKIVSIFNWIRKSKLRVLAVLVVFLLVISGFVLYNSQSTRPQYQTATVEKGTIVSSVSASGTVLNANISPITTTASGVVSTVYVKDGEKADQGQKIADITLDSTGQLRNASNWSSYLSAKNTVDSAKVSLLTLQSDMFSKWDTFKKLAENDTYENSDGTPKYTERGLPEFHIAEKNWLAAEAKYKNQQAVIIQAQAVANSAWLSYQTSSPTITAPIDGPIDNITIVPGMVLSGSISDSTTNSERVAVIHSDGNPLISVNLSEIDVPQVAPGQKATVTVDALADKTFTGIIVSVDRIGSVTSGVTNYPAIISLDTNMEELLPNMSVNANIILNTKTDVLWLPATAVSGSGENAAVRVLKNGQEQVQPVITGIASATQIEIISGINEGDRVITGTTTTPGETNQNTRSVFSGGFGGGNLRVIR